MTNFNSSHDLCNTYDHPGSFHQPLKPFAVAANRKIIHSSSQNIIMKKILFALLSLGMISAQAQTADEVIQKYSAAAGGLENFQKIQTVKMSGTVTAQGNDFTVTIQIVNGKSMRSDVEISGQTITNVYNGGKGWKINPFAGATTATEVTGSELNDFKTQSFLANQLMDYKSRGYKAEFTGQEDVNGSKANKIKLTTEDNKVTTYYIDATTNMVVKSVTTRNIQGNDLEIETYFSDVKDFNGMKFSMTRTQKAQGEVFQEVHFDKIELNVPIDEKIFTM
jgi:hypothetical protein